MGLIVVDASAAVEVLAIQDSPRREATRARMTAAVALYAPPHMDIEVISALRRLAHKDQGLAAYAPDLIAEMLTMPIRREPLVGPVAERMWELRPNMTVYDAAYVALAECLNASLLTCDAKFTRTPGVKCAVELIA